MKALLLLFLVLSSCTEESEKISPETPLELGKRYVSDGAFRRSLLETSFVNPENGYSQLRAEKYGPGNRWEELEVWNPPSRELTADAKDRPFSKFADIDFDNISEDELLEIGKAAFERFPLGIDLQIESHQDAPANIGMWEFEGRIGGLAELSISAGIHVAKTCSTCHSKTISGELVHGVANSDFLYGKVNGANWGHGTIDVTGDGKSNPTSIPDIRPIRFQNHLHWAATLRNNLGALAVRIETLFITSYSQQLRPPRTVVFALAFYFWSLGKDLNIMSETEANTFAGYQHFKNQCSSCHRLDGSTAPPIAIEVIGTDPDVGESSRGTGKYRIPSLAGVGTRGRFLHDASVDSLEDLFSPTRSESVPGHVFGLGLNEEERSELVSFLKKL